jgi:hypothetical protein
MKTRSELTEQERMDLEQRRFNGEFDRRRLIRFGYLSVAERRRLRETLPGRTFWFRDTSRIPFRKCAKHPS